MHETGFAVRERAESNLGVLLLDYLDHYSTFNTEVSKQHPKAQIDQFALAI